MLAVLVLVCVPGLTRMSQKLETASHAELRAGQLSAQKVTVTSATAMASPVPLANFDLVRSCVGVCFRHSRAALP